MDTTGPFATVCVEAEKSYLCDLPNDMVSQSRRQNLININKRTANLASFDNFMKNSFTL